LSRANADDACWWQPEGAALACFEAGRPRPARVVVAQVDALRAAVGKVVPGKRQDRNPLIGTWKVRAFGDPRQDLAATPAKNG
jgi:hypothetical protein